MDQGFVLVDLCTRSMAQSCVPRACVRSTTAGAPRCQKHFHPQKTSSRGYKLQRWHDPGRVDGSCLQEGSGTWSRLASLLELCETSRLLLPHLGHPCPTGVSCRGVVPEMRRACHTVPDFPVSPICIWAMLELMAPSSCAGSTSAVDCPEISRCPGLKALSRRLSGTMFAMASSEPPCTSRGSLMLL